MLIMLATHLRGLCLVDLLQAEIDGVHAEPPDHRRERRLDRDTGCLVHHPAHDANDQQSAGYHLCDSARVAVRRTRHQGLRQRIANRENGRQAV